MIKKGLLIVFVYLVAACSNPQENSTEKISSSQSISSLNTPTNKKRPGNGSNESNNPPEIWGIPATSVEVNQLYRFEALASDADGDRLRFSISNLPNWMAFHKPTGVLSGTPNSTDLGEFENIIIRVTDGTDSIALSPFTINVTTPPLSLNLPPEINGTPASEIDEGINYYFNPAIIDEDVNQIIVSAQNLPQWLTLNPNTGELNGTPSFNNAGLYDGIVLIASDGVSSSELGPFSIQVINVNRAPIISGETINTNEDSTISFTVNAEDPDADTIQISPKTSPQFGQIQIPTTTALDIVYIPHADYFGTDVFEILVIDTFGASSYAQFNVNITAINDIPNAQPDSLIVTEGISTVLDVLSNDSGLGDGSVIDGSLKMSLDSQPSQGSVSFNNDGTLNYISKTSPASSDSFTYKVTDPDNETAIASVNVSINAECESNCTISKTISWDPNSESDIKGYYVYHGRISGEYFNEIWVGNNTYHELQIANTGTHYFAVKAVNNADIASDFSEEYILAK